MSFERIYLISGKITPWLAVVSIVCLLSGWILGFGFTPMDYQQKDSFRIIYLHVPAAMWSMGIYALMAIAAFITQVWQKKFTELLLVSMAPVGAVFTFIALATGSTWGKPMWGTWWEWDARLTSELLLLFLYLGAIALYGAFNDRRVAAQAMSILVLVGVINLPIIHFSVEWWNTLHQSSTRMQQSIDPSMRMPLRLAIVGYFTFFVTVTVMRLRNQIVLLEQHQPWVRSLLSKENR